MCSQVSCNVSGEVEENREKHQSRQLISQLKSALPTVWSTIEQRSTMHRHSGVWILTSLRALELLEQSQTSDYLSVRTPPNVPWPSSRQQNHLSARNPLHPAATKVIRKLHKKGNCIYGKSLAYVPQLAY